MKLTSHSRLTPGSRRRFLSLSTAALAGLALPRGARSQDQPEPLSGHLDATLSVDPNAVVFTLPASFTGLSYEAAQLANPTFFSAANTALVRLFRELSPSGVLRIGGGTSEYTTFSEQTPTEPAVFEIFGPDTSKTAKQGTVTSALALRNLRGFLDATGWSCLYGLNLGQGTKENATAEAAAVYRLLGPRVLALQIGNEPDSFRGRFRPRSYGPQDFLREWNEFRAAILARTPQANFAGPDISNKLSFLTAFAQQAPQHPDVILLTAHYYAMGPAGRPDATIENLLSADPRSATLKWSDVPIVEDAMRAAHLPLRISEAGSCWNGGQLGVSNTFASALWCADVMLRFASLGFSGINLHGGGNGIYSPIVGAPSSGFTRRPEFFGMQFAQQLAGSALLSSSLECPSDRVTAYAARSAQGHLQLALINKTATTVEMHFAGRLPVRHNVHIQRLTAPSVTSETGVTLSSPASIKLHRPLMLEPYSAVLLTP